MQKNFSNLSNLIRNGASLRLRADDFRYSEILTFVKLAANNETELALVIGDSLSVSEISSLASIGKNFLTLDFT